LPGSWEPIVTVHGLFARLGALIRKRQFENELDGEIAAHLELAERDALASGMSPEQARIAARRQFGGIESMKEDHRDGRSFRWLENASRDIRYGLAGLGRDPGFTAVVVGVLALGIGANVAMFGLLDAVMLKPLPVRESRSDRAHLGSAPSGRNERHQRAGLPRLAAHGNNVRSTWGRIADLDGAYGAGDPVRLDGRAVTADYFRVFDVGVQLGRTFQPRDVEPGNEAVIVLSNAIWETVFGADRGIVNRKIMLDGQPHEVIGVLRPGAFDRDEEVRFWKPLVLQPGQYKRGMHWLMVHGRLRPNVSSLQARDEMRRIAVGLRDVSPSHKHTWLVEVEPLRKLLLGDNLRRSMYLMFGAVVLVLLIACANIANLLLAKARRGGRKWRSARRSELLARGSGLSC
jgi:putative ABC transport system permease protein